VTASIGVSFYLTVGDNVIDLMKRADVALYRAKDQGRNNYQIYSSSMDSTSYQSFLMERDLHKTLNQGEFLVYY
jgi:predicted signal transduction protein with EAL and GGDEF domain